MTQRDEARTVTRRHGTVGDPDPQPGGRQRVEVEGVHIGVLGVRPVPARRPGHGPRQPRSGHAPQRRPRKQGRGRQWPGHVVGTTPEPARAHDAVRVSVLGPHSVGDQPVGVLVAEQMADLVSHRAVRRPDGQVSGGQPPVDQVRPVGPVQRRGAGGQDEQGVAVSRRPRIRPLERRVAEQLQRAFQLAVTGRARPVAAVDRGPDRVIGGQLHPGGDELRAQADPAVGAVGPVVGDAVPLHAGSRRRPAEQLLDALAGPPGLGVTGDADAQHAEPGPGGHGQADSGDDQHVARRRDLALGVRTGLDRLVGRLRLAGEGGLAGGQGDLSRRQPAAGRSAVHHDGARGPRRRLGGRRPGDGDQLEHPGELDRAHLRWFHRRRVRDGAGGRAEPDRVAHRGGERVRGSRGQPVDRRLVGGLPAVSDGDADLLRAVADRRRADRPGVGLHVADAQSHLALPGLRGRERRDARWSLGRCVRGGGRRGAQCEVVADLCRERVGLTGGQVAHGGLVGRRGAGSHRNGDRGAAVCHRDRRDLACDGLDVAHFQQRPTLAGLGGRQRRLARRQLRRDVGGGARRRAQTVGGADPGGEVVGPPGGQLVESGAVARRTLHRDLPAQMGDRHRGDRRARSAHPRDPDHSLADSRPGDRHGRPAGWYLGADDPVGPRARAGGVGRRPRWRREWLG